MAKRAFSGPELSKVNIGNRYKTAEEFDVAFPNPGPNIEYGGDAGGDENENDEMEARYQTASQGFIKRWFSPNPPTLFFYGLEQN